MQQRYYDPLIGRFYSNDPVGFTASNPMMFNRYAYANNNPYKYTDPDGRFAFVIPAIPYVVKGAVAARNAYTAYRAVRAVQNIVQVAEATKDSTAKPVKDVEGVKVNDDGSGAVEIGVETAGGEVTIVGEVSMDEGTLTIGGGNGAHIDGPGGGSVGLSGIKEAGRKVGEAYGASEVKIQGGTRTTGANPGKEPREITIKVK
jgi:uncharacterized protein RhaS with RHS repeats